MTGRSERTEAVSDREHLSTTIERLTALYEAHHNRGECTRDWHDEIDRAFPRLTAAIAAAEAERDEARLRLLSAAGDDLCRLSQEEIKELSSGGVKIPPKEEFLASCERFHSQIAGEAGVLSGCFTLAQLIAENEKQRADLAASRERERVLREEASRLCESLGRCTLLKGESATMDVERDLAHLRAALSDSPSPWRPISDVPKDGTEILGWYGSDEIYVVFWSQTTGWVDALECREMMAPEKWQPLPSPPKETTK